MKDLPSDNTLVALIEAMIDWLLVIRGINTWTYITLQARSPRTSKRVGDLIWEKVDFFHGWVGGGKWTFPNVVHGPLLKN